MGVRYNNGRGYLVMHSPGNQARVCAVLTDRDEAKTLSKQLGSTAFVKDIGKAARGDRGPAPKVTNEEFAAQDRLFIKACELADVEVTPRQASRWRNGHGSAFRFKREAQKMINRAGPEAS